jgi:penicillin G amidase
MTLVGLPVVVFGRNRAIAWGGTSLMADVQDLEVLTTNPKQANQYLDHGTWRDMKVSDVRIGSRAAFPAFLRPAAEPARYRLRRTEEGPVVSDAVAPEGPAMVLHWTGFISNDASYESLLKVNYARDWQDFVEAFRNFVAPAMSLVYADAQGNIGKLSVGRIPIRGHGNGSLPSRDWEARDRWIGFVPYDALPRQYNPLEGFLIAANDDPGGHSGYFISNDFAQPYRARRIAALIERFAGGATVADMAKIQSDTMDDGTSRLRGLLAKTPAPDSARQTAVAYLSRWNGDMGVDSVGATIYTVWVRHIRERLAERAVPELLGRHSDHAVIDRLFLALSDDKIVDLIAGTNSPWCRPDRAASEPSCGLLVEEALNDTMLELRREAGSDVAHWTFGTVHHAVYAHTPFSAFSAIARFFEARVPSGGSQNAINVANAVHRESEGYEQTFGAGFRQVIEPGVEGRSGQWFMISTGQSGNPLSPHYRDMVGPFTDARLIELKAPAPETARANYCPGPRGCS